jgi:hypothetical protein
MTEETGFPQLLQMQEMTAAIRTLVANQERLQAEQEHAGRALGELGLIMKNHADVLRGVQGAVIRLWEEVGLPTEEQPPPLPEQVN